MRFLKRLCKDKRGLALESAILFMVIVFSLCTLLTSLALIGRYRVDMTNDSFLSRVALEQIGEDFLAGDLQIEYESYAYTATDTELTVWRKNDENKTPLLYVKLEKTEAGTSVLIWK